MATPCSARGQTINSTTAFIDCDEPWLLRRLLYWVFECLESLRETPGYRRHSVLRNGKGLGAPSAPARFLIS